MENKFKKGLILGGLLAVAAAAGFVMSKKGHELTEDVQKDLKTLAKHVKKNLSKMEDVTKESFDDVVTKIVEAYAKTKHMAADAKETLIETMQAKWQEMEAEYLEEKEQEKQ